MKITNFEDISDDFVQNKIKVKSIIFVPWYPKLKLKKKWKIVLTPLIWVSNLAADLLIFLICQYLFV